MWILACCNDEGNCFGFLSKDRTVITDIKLLEDSDYVKKNILSYKTKKETNEICTQINLSHALLPNGFAFRVCPVKA